MRTLEFAEKYAFDYKRNKIDLYEFQKELLNEFDDKRYILTLSSRQMGCSSMLSLYIANWLINNDTDMKRLVILVDKPNTKIASIRAIINNYCEINNIENLETAASTRSLYLNNGNSILITNNLLSIDITPQNSFGLVVDNAAWIRDLIGQMAYAIPVINKLIMVSGFNVNKNDFYDKLFISDNNLFKKIKITWDLHPNHNEEWYKTQEELFKYGTSFYSEIHLERKEKSNPPKNNMINVRLTDELLMKISRKLLEKDISVSEYIRQLIEND